MLNGINNNNSKLLLYEQHYISFKDKFYLFMDLLITTQHSSHLECFIFLTIFYFQHITGFFSIQANFLKPHIHSIDNILSYIEKIFRLKNLFLNNKQILLTFISFLFIVLILLSITFIILITTTTKHSLHSIGTKTFNYLIKFYNYICFNICLDLIIINFCFESNNINPYIINSNCDIKSNFSLYLTYIVLIAYCIFLRLFLLIFTYDGLFLLKSCYAKISSNYDIYITLNCIMYSLLLNLNKVLSVYVFMAYNCVSSIVFGVYVYKVCVYYNKMARMIIWVFHVVYIWASLFFFIVKVCHVDNCGVLFVISSGCLGWVVGILEKRFEKELLYKTAFTNISNANYRLFYIQNLIEQIERVDLNDDEKAMLTGIIEVHLTEYNEFSCVHKDIKYNQNKIDDNDNSNSNNNKNIKNSKPTMYNKSFLNHFIIDIANYFLKTDSTSVDLLINLSLFYLKIIGNTCQSIFFSQKANAIPKSIHNTFTYKRLQLLINRSLIEQLKHQNEPCLTLEDVNTSLFFKYDHLSIQFIKQIEIDIKHTFDFWNTLKQGKTTSLNYNALFALTDTIRVTKLKVNELFHSLYTIYTGVNDLFELYLSYVEIINDDDVLKRELDNIKRKSDISTVDMLNVNYYNVLFSKDTGIIIACGDKGKEGIIVESNRTITEMFGYGKEEIKGMNVSCLMPKTLEKKHLKFIERYYESGEKKLIDKVNRVSFGKDRNDNVFEMKIMLKIFPILNKNLFFVAMLNKEKSDNIILTDEMFNIVSMSAKLYMKFGMYLKNVFAKYEIPFFVLCKKFVHFYKGLMKVKNKKHNIIRKKQVNMNMINNNNNNDLVMSNQMLYNTNNHNRKSLLSQTHFINNNNYHKDSHGITILSNYNMETIRSPRKRSSNICYNNDTHIRKTNVDDNNNNNLIYGGGGAGSSNHKKLPSIQVTSFIEVNNHNNDTNNNNIVFSIPKNSDSLSKYQSHAFNNQNIQAPYLSTINKTNFNNIDLSDITETTYEIVIPNFIPVFAQYLLLTSTKSSQNTHTNIDDNDVISEYSNESIINDVETVSNQIDDLQQDETANLIKPTSSFNTKQYNVCNYNTPNSTHQLNIKTETQLPLDEIVFTDKLNHYKKYFFEGHFDQLDEYIKYNNTETPCTTFQYNLIFDKYNYGDNECMFVIKCLEIKNEFDISNSNESEEARVSNIINTNEYTNIIKKEKNEALDTLHDITEDNKHRLLEIQEEFFKLVIDNSIFRKLLKKNQDDILKLSRIHGMKKGLINNNNIIEDENSSQSSQVGYNEDLSKKSRIEEIRNNALKNINDFYMLRYFRLLNIIILIITIIVVICFLVFFLNVTNDYITITKLNNTFFISSNWVSFLISSIMSLRTLHLLENTSLYEQYNTYLDNKDMYISTLKNKSVDWIIDIADALGFIEDKMNYYLHNDKYNLWDKRNFQLPLNQNESFPLYLEQLISTAGSLVKHVKFLNNNDNVSTINDVNVNVDIDDIEIDYLTKVIINNGYLMLIPDYIDKMGRFPVLMKMFINKTVIIFQTVLIAYGLVLCVFEVLFCVVTYFTNKNIEEGFKKITTIKEDKIDEMIKRIEGFNVMLIKYIEINYKYTAQIFEDWKGGGNSGGCERMNTKYKKEMCSSQNNNNNINNKEYTLTSKPQQLTNANNNNTNNNDNINQTNNTHSINTINEQLSNSEKTKDKPLKLLTSSYFHPFILNIIIFSLLISCYFIINNLHNQMIKIIDIQIYFHSKIFISSEQLLRLKFQLSKHFNESIPSDHLSSGIFDFDNNINHKALINSISEFKYISLFYTYLRIDICNVINSQQSEQERIALCNKDPIIKQMNNTNSIIDNIPYRTLLLFDLYKLRLRKDVNYDSFLIYVENDYKESEKLLFQYLTPLSDEVVYITNHTVSEIIKDKKILICLILVLLIIVVIIYCVFSWVIFIKKIAYLLTVSRSVLTIIPSVVISATQEIENWIDKKY